MAVNKKINTDTENLAGNIDLGFSTKKKRFSVGGDTSKIIEFDPSDIGVANRLSKSLSKFKDLEVDWEKLNNNIENTSDDNMDEIDKFSTKFDDIEKSMRELIDYIFDGNVADKLLDNSSAFSPVNGKFKFEYIIEAMLNCYEQQIRDEAPKFNTRKVNTYTHKYINK